MTDQIDALNAIGELVAARNYDGAAEIAARLDHGSLALAAVALVRMRAESVIEFFLCQGLSEDEAKEQAAGFFRAGFGFPRKRFA